MSTYGRRTEWVEHFDPDDPLMDPYDDDPTLFVSVVDYIGLWDDPTGGNDDEEQELEDTEGCESCVLSEECDSCYR